jgi:O-antigen ligase
VAGAFAAVLVAFGILAAARAVPASRILLLSALALSATVDLVGRVQVGPTTAYAWLTGAIATAALSMALLAPSNGLMPSTRRVLGFMTLLPAWAVLSVVWAPVDLNGAQNALAYVAFVALVAVATHATASGQLTFPVLRDAMLITFSVGSALYCASLAFDGLGGSDVVSARAYALFAAVGVGWCAALGRNGYRAEFWMAFLLSGLAFMSLSRTAFVTSILLLTLGMLGMRSMREVARSAIVACAVSVVALSLYSYSNPFSARFHNGDVVTVAGDFSLNVMGRKQLWQATWDSALDHPVAGGGLGSADVAVRRASPTDDNPHNDYLRVFHDLGLVGLALLLIALVAPVSASAAAYRATPRIVRQRRSAHLAGMLVLMSLGLGMTTDNALIYLFVLAPVALAVGSSLGQRDRTIRETTLVIRSQ